MSLFNRINRLTSNVLSGARQLASSVIPESVRRRVTDFGNWVTGYVGPEQTSQVLNEIVEHVRTNYPPRQPFEVRESNSALRNFARVYTVDGMEGYDGRTFLNDAENSMTKVLRENRQTKVKLIFKCYMIKEGPDGERIRPFDFHYKIEVNLEGTDENELYNNMLDTIEEKIQKLQHAEVTGWRLHSVINLELHTTRYNPLRGETWIPLPKELANKKVIINMKNEDNKCFLWCVLRALNPKDGNPERLDKKLKEKENTLNMEGIEYPVSLKDLNKFENQNPTISITVFGYERKIVYPLRNSDNMDREHKIRLMLIEKDGVQHYCLVKNPSCLLSSQVSKHNGKKYFCDRCLNPFWCEQSLNKHLEFCSNHEAVKIEMPKKDSILKFKNYYNSEKVPFMIYADMESLLNPIQSCEPNPQSSYTKKYQKHQPISYSYYIKCFDDNVFTREPRTYTGLDAMQKFVESLEKDVKEIANILKVDMIFGKKKKQNDLTRKLNVGYVKKI